MVKVCAVPGQPLADGVTVISPWILEDPLFVVGNAEILPVPVDASPMDVLSLAQV